MGEVVEQATRGEASKEIGLELGEPSLLGVFSSQELFHCHPKGDEVYNITIIHPARGWQGGVHLNSENTAWDWFAHAGTPSDIGPLIKPGIE